MFELSHRLSVVNWSCRHLLERSQHQSIQPFLYLLLCTWAYTKWDLDESVVHLTVKDKHSHSYGQFGVPGWPLALVFGPCDTPGEPANSTQKDPVLGDRPCNRSVPVRTTATIVLHRDRQPSTSDSLPLSCWGNVSRLIKWHVKLECVFFAHGNILCADEYLLFPHVHGLSLQLHSSSSCIGSRIGCCWIFPILFLLSTVTHPWGPDRDALQVVC